MNHPIIVLILLAAGVLAIFACCLGICLMRGAASRLHYAAALSIFGPLPIIIAVLVEEGFSQTGMKALLLVVLLAAEGPLIVHMIGRACAPDRIRKLK